MKYRVGESGWVEATGKWPTTKTGAIKESVKKWKFVSEFIDREGIVPGCDTYSCSLCHLYIEGACEECPVREETGLEFCDGSPFSWYSDAILSTRIRKIAADAEVQFLESLLEPK